MPIHLVDVEIFHRIRENFDPLVVLEEKPLNTELSRFILWAP